MHELLVPVGDYESLQYAIANGCDAVYLGYKKFNARAYAKNFCEEELRDAVKLCHLYGVKIYITMNTLVKDQEVTDFLDTVSFLYKIGVDALIMQDFGMICLVREKFPDLEVHTSTQANVATKEAVELFYKLGVKRVVLPREMSLAEISKIDVPIEKEVFIHGALCMSYSGCCLMSSMIGSRSGNRGECTGCCRLFYQLYKNDEKVRDGYLLSTKELNVSSRIEALLKSDIVSFKIEGRMKSPLYVGFITRFYRRLIDGEKFSYEQELEKLRILFNREYTLGHLFEDDIRNSTSPNHLGLKIGEVLEVTTKKIKVKLSYPLYQEDGLRFYKARAGFVANFIYDINGRLISKAEAGSVIFLDNKIHLKNKDILYKTTSKKIYDDILNLKDKKIPISISVQAFCGRKLVLIIRDLKNEVVVTSNTVEEAQNAPISKERIERQLRKLGDTVFVCQEVEIEMDENIFISIKELNELRRKAVLKLQDIRENPLVAFHKRKLTFPVLPIDVKKGISIKVETEEQLQQVFDTDISSIYVPRQIYQKYKDNPRCILSENFSGVQTESLCLRKFYRTPINDISDYTFNVFNIYSVYYLLKLGYKKVTLSVELSNEEIFLLFTHFKEVFHFTPSLEVIVYDRVVVMNIFGNILELEQGSFSYFLEDDHHRKFPVVYKDGFTYIYHYEVMKRDISLFSSLPISLRYSFSFENATNMHQIVNK